MPWAARSWPARDNPGTDALPLRVSISISASGAPARRGVDSPTASGRGGTVDAADLKSAFRKEVWVRFPPPAPANRRSCVTPHGRTVFLKVGNPHSVTSCSFPRILLTGQTSLLVRRWVLPEDAVVRSCGRWFQPDVRILTAVACRYSRVQKQQRVGRDK